MSNQFKLISKHLQTKFSQYISNVTSMINLPKKKFVEDITRGMYISKSIHLNGIARSLNESISPKKTSERLSYNIGKPELYFELETNYLSSLKHKIKNYDYIIYDGSDIQKKHAKNMEGIKFVRDGSRSSNKGKSTFGNGYHWDNYMAVNDNGVLPLVSDIYSTALDKDFEKSENYKILSTIGRIREYTESKSVLVIDRGGDRRVLVEKFIEMNQNFIIRQKGNRHLFLNDKLLPLKTISRKIKLCKEFKIERTVKNKKTINVFDVGATQVFMPDSYLKSKINTPLWLISSKGRGKGYSWFLAYIDTIDKYEAMDIVMKGYAQRWKIEEFHRQVKQDYNLEHIILKRYSAIRNMGIIIAILMGFLCTLPQNIVEDMIIIAKLLHTKKLKDLPNYIYYRLTEAIKYFMFSWKKYSRKRNKIPDLQLYLKLEFEI